MTELDKIRLASAYTAEARAYAAIAARCNRAAVAAAFAAAAEAYRAAGDHAGAMRHDRNARTYGWAS